jgi:hypothetical protein
MTLLLKIHLPTALLLKNLLRLKLHLQTAPLLKILLPTAHLLRPLRRLNLHLQCSHSLPLFGMYQK